MIPVCAKGRQVCCRYWRASDYFSLSGKNSFYKFKRGGLIYYFCRWLGLIAARSLVSGVVDKWPLFLPGADRS